ncbi:MAG: hypothetical protein ACRDRI_12990 [Pseudonocardiaceae bacterium]
MLRDRLGATASGGEPGTPTVPSEYLFDESLDDFRAALVWNLATPLALYVNKILTQGGRWRGELPILQRCLQAIEDWDALTVL